MTQSSRHGIMRQSKASRIAGQTIAFGLMASATTFTAATAQQGGTYTNPAIKNAKFGDPSVTRVDKTLYAYASGQDKQNTDLPLVQMSKTTDFVTWTDPVTVMARPQWQLDGAGMEAPDMVANPNAASGQKPYIMYFATVRKMNPGESDQTSCIGSATADSPDGPFTPEPQWMICGFQEHTIDPNVIQDAQGKWWMYYGSLITLQRIALDPDDITKINKVGGQQVASQPVLSSIPCDNQMDGYGGQGNEASWVIRRNGYYYMFTSGDYYAGSPGSYKVFVARSKVVPGSSAVNFEFHHEPDGAPHPCTGHPDNTMGPAIPVLHDKGANAKPANDKTGFLGDWVDPGSNATFVDGANQMWIAYHARHYDPGSNNADSGKRLLIDRLQWDADGWPYVEGGLPSDTLQSAPTPYP